MFPEVESAIRTFFAQLTEVLGFTGYLIIFLGVELLFILLFIVKSMLSYEARLKRRLNQLNKWIFKTKKIDEENIKVFTRKIKKGPRRLRYFWQQFILYREGNPSTYLTEDNLIGKPLKTSSWQSNVKNLGIITVVWSFVSLVFGLASQTNQNLTLQNVAVGLVAPALVGVLGVFTIVVLKAQRVSNLDDLYHIYHLFARFIDNACADLTPYIDFDLLFTPKEIEKGNTQLREYYEARTRKAKEEFEQANKNDLTYVEYKFDEVGVDGSLLLNRALKESEIYINQKTSTLSQISQIEAQKEALKRNYENVVMDLQRKIQASKENIAKLIEQQAATTSRIEVGLLRQQQEKEVGKQAALQKDYDAEEKRYVTQRNELDADIEKYKKVLDEGKEEIEKAMAAEYQTFYEKIIKSAYAVADNKVSQEKRDLTNTMEKTEGELINVQTQIKRLKDENDTLRAKVEEAERALEDRSHRKKSKKKDDSQEKKGEYDRAGNYVYTDGSYHDAQGLFHDVDGKIYNLNGELVSYEESEEEKREKEEKRAINEQKEQFGKHIPFEPSEEYKNIGKKEEPPQQTAPEPVKEEPAEEPAVPATPYVEEYAPVEETPAEQLVSEEYVPAEEPATEEYVPAEEPTYTEEEYTPVTEDYVPEGANVEEYVPEGATVEEYVPEGATVEDYVPEGAVVEEYTPAEDVNPVVEEYTPTEETPAEQPVSEEYVSAEEPKGTTEEPTDEEPNGDTDVDEYPDDDTDVDEYPDDDTDEYPDDDTDDEYPDDDTDDEYPDDEEDYYTSRRGRPKKTLQDLITVKAAESKRRGRPRKVKKEQKAVEEKPRKKAGRPKKVQPVVKANPKKKVGRPKKVQETKLTELRKRPGRPKKVVEEPRKKAGRPRKETQEPKVVENKKGPGRPKKEVKKGPGRPKKEVKKAPGRPRKEEPIKKAGRPKKVVEEPKKKAGRPRKEANVNENLEDVFGKQDEKLNRKREKLLEEIDQLTLQAERAKRNGSDKELAKVNKKLEDMINKLSALNG